MGKLATSLVAVALGLGSLVVSQPAQASFRSTYGTEFWVNFDENFGGPSEQPGLFLAGRRQAQLP